MTSTKDKHGIQEICQKSTWNEILEKIIKNAMRYSNFDCVMISAQYDKLVICKKLENFTRIRDLKVLQCAYLPGYI